MTSQNNVEELIIQCDCGEYSYLQITVFDEDTSTLYVAISSQPPSWKFRLRDAWDALLGRKWTVSNEVILSDVDKKRLRDFLK